MLLIITSIGDVLLVVSTSMTFNNFEPPKKVFGDFCNFFAPQPQELILTKWMEVDQGDLRTGTAIGCRASHKH